jgi:hypothetical protein
MGSPVLIIIGSTPLVWDQRRLFDRHHAIGSNIRQSCRGNIGPSDFDKRRSPAGSRRGRLNAAQR